MTRILSILLIALPFLRAESSAKDDCRRPTYLPRLPQRLQGEDLYAHAIDRIKKLLCYFPVLEIWTDPEPETTLTYADEPVIFKPSCEWRMSRTKLLLAKLSRAEYYRVFPRPGPSPPRTTARVVPAAARQRPAPPAPQPARPATPPPTPRYSTLARRVAPPCRPPATVARLPPSVRARIRAIWRRQRPGMSCGEMHRKTKQIMINMPLRFRAALGRSRQKTTLSSSPSSRAEPSMDPKPSTSSRSSSRAEPSSMTPKASMLKPTTKSVKPMPKAAGAPQLDCKLPHFLNRLEPALQEKLRRVWSGFRQGEDCSERVTKQLSILKANDISVESFRMPFPSLYDDELTPMRRRASMRA